MALTQHFPDFKLKSLPSELKTITSDEKSDRFSFRKGGDLEYMTTRVISGGRFEIDAAPGAGKSTDFPQSILKGTSMLVVHVMPFPQLAAHLAEWHVSRANYIDPVLISTLEEDFPKSGYVITSAALIVAKWLQFGLESLAGAILLQDESHESGAASAVIRKLSQEAKLHAYVAMSATHSGGEFRALETRGMVSDRQYVPETFADPWSVLQDGAPWAIDRIQRCLMIFEDDETRAADLISAYNLHGAMAMRWNSKTSVKKFMSDVNLIRTIRHVRYVIVADSTYRSGYTLPVQTIVDSGYVRRTVDIGSGAFKQVSRKIYLFEKHQTMARGGRTIGLSTSYYRPSVALESKRCVMEQTDVEAYVLLMRLLGHSCAHEYPSARFNFGNVPKNPCEALNNGVPLSCVVDHQLCPIEQLVVIGQERSSLESGIESPIEVPLPQNDFSFQAVSESLREIVEAVEIEEPQPASFGSPLLDSEKSRELRPDDVITLVESIRAYFSQSLLGNVCKFVWSPDELEINKSIASARYNYYLAKCMGVMSALEDIKQRATDKDKVSLMSWAKRYGEILVICQAEMKMWFRVVEIIADDKRGFYKGPDIYADDIENFKVEVLSSYKALPKRVTVGESTRSYAADKRLESRFRSKLLEFE